MPIQKLIASITLLAFLLSSLHVPMAGAQPSPSPQGEKPAANWGVVKIVAGGPRDDEGWSIVRSTPIEGRVIVVSEKVGSEIDLTERNFYGLFQGETIYKSPLIQSVQMPVDGFRSATFIQLPDSAVAVKITFGFGGRSHSRLLRMRDRSELRYIRNYLDHFEEIDHGKYRLRKEAGPDTVTDYPRYTEEKAGFEETRPLFHVMRRSNVMVTRKDGRQIQGEVVPTFDGNAILIESDSESIKIPTEDIAKVRFAYVKGGRMMSTAVKMAFSGALSGALVGALAAWQTDSDVGQNVLWASAILGSIGFLGGLLSGGRGQGDRGGEFVLGPVTKKPGNGHGWDE